MVVAGVLGVVLPFVPVAPPLSPDFFVLGVFVPFFFGTDFLVTGDVGVTVALAGAGAPTVEPSATPIEARAATVVAASPVSDPKIKGVDPAAAFATPTTLPSGPT